MIIFSNAYVIQILCTFWVQIKHNCLTTVSGALSNQQNTSWHPESFLAQLTLKSRLFLRFSVHFPSEQKCWAWCWQVQSYPVCPVGRGRVLDLTGPCLHWLWAPLAWLWHPSLCGDTRDDSAVPPAPASHPASSTIQMDLRKQVLYLGTCTPHLILQLGKNQRQDTALSVKGSFIQHLVC